ncbi:multidrug transporter [Novimethylophilus kurashikiensis]|uniref:Multidrug transporter n=1 Tax=Novimethylophilus kurashikiensis TaxID=1825523 RepID=A0A2R5F8F1_9PROT|nr:hypothetical protein [Novimethylophilus kurashikiensis]GBG14522.1 multidrug transporter [Novimethylophilus kurashikiensis]
MAEKLTESQKALNKEATRLRNKAYNARKAAFYAAVDAAEQTIRDGALGAASDSSSKALDAAITQRNAALAEIRAQIEVLTAKLAETEAAYSPVLSELRAVRDDAYTKLRAAEREVRQKIEQDYADVADCNSATQWKDFEEFLPDVAGKTE